MSHEHVHPRTGESSCFHFETVWRVNASPDAVWAVLSQVADWPAWWPGLAAADPVGENVAPGSRAHIQVRSPIGLSLNFAIEAQTVEPPHRVSFAATGDLRGNGVWTLTAIGPITRIDSVWCVTTGRALIRVLRPLSGVMHAAVMRAGERGLAGKLAADAER